MLDAFLVVVWAVYLVDLFVAPVPGAWTFRGRRGAMRASASPDVELAGGFALVRQPFLPWDAAVAAGGSDLTPATAARVAEVFGHARPLAVASSILAAVLLLGLPAIRVGWLTPVAWVALAAAMWVITIVLFRRVWRAVHQRGVPLETWIATLGSPVGASRSVCAVYWRSLEALHPVAAAAALCDDRELLRVARLWHHDAPALREPILALLASRGLDERLAAPPDDDALPHYCPRCGCGYASFAEACRDCRVGLAARPDR